MCKWSRAGEEDKQQTTDRKNKMKQQPNNHLSLWARGVWATAATYFNWLSLNPDKNRLHARYPGASGIASLAASSSVT
jgi:hypothetical protein